MKAKQLDVEIDFYEERHHNLKFMVKKVKAIPKNCQLKIDSPDGFHGSCEKRDLDKNECIVGCIYCRGINIWTNKCLCVYDKN